MDIFKLKGLAAETDAHARAMSTPEWMAFTIHNGEIWLCINLEGLEEVPREMETTCDVIVEFINEDAYRIRKLRDDVIPDGFFTPEELRIYGLTMRLL